jgi:hypothetical protein
VCDISPDITPEAFAAIVEALGRGTEVRLAVNAG